MTARDTYYSSLATNHTNAEHAGVSGLPGASPPGNAASWSRDVARAALVAGTLKQSDFITAMNQLAGWEQAQNSLAKATLRNSGDNAPV
jgi:hypothetical protein